MLGTYCVIIIFFSHRKNYKYGGYFCCILLLIRILFFIFQNAGKGSLHLWSRCVESTAIPLFGFPHPCTPESHRYVHTQPHVCLYNELEDKRERKCTEQQHYQRLQQEGFSVDNFFSRVVQLKWIGRFPPRGMPNPDLQWNTGVRGRTQQPSVMKAKRNTTSSAKKTLLKDAWHPCSAIVVRWLGFVCLLEGYNRVREQQALWISNSQMREICASWAEWWYYCMAECKQFLYFLVKFPSDIEAIL